MIRRQAIWIHTLKSTSTYMVVKSPPCYVLQQRRLILVSAPGPIPLAPTFNPLPYSSLYLIEHHCACDLIIKQYISMQVGNEPFKRLIKRKTTGAAHNAFIRIKNLYRCKRKYSYLPQKPKSTPRRTVP